MSYMIYLSLNGKKQGLISAGCSTLDSIGNRYQKGHEDKIQVLSLNHSLMRQQNVSHNPIQFVKPIDKSSPLLAMAIDSNESLNGAFIFYRTSQVGQLELFYEVKITEATITDLSCVYPHSINEYDKMPYEKVVLNYKSITWNHITAGTSAYSIWEDRVL
ncbi:Hcp family type VI secretion system effector [Xenorhabdus bovienii]|uniref:Hcp family type VI secretion system effector n=2 Tax=Xenorhabdus bovienii TaxID=40576 RepID=UPI00237C5A87|nr:Hcp family type VI secretion system effector [Xenorhabdus bovienii]MDE1497076.1 Hcp family type VI secretion system effector [Xenorhabdus bovienii]MDE9437878.1 Hcp family type VI secretion system effector [Xenorhabdus bovienii]MDE9447475.1 Hcp family type VI secretion system effector [Xenorhabdus bovienii]MDE9475019.1 Hcp family type VI secretion system effector [Xenorhabdus bovienii]MDE9499701.1 Hcp family type VI secretion system effector [Xenorhabdus bovienii]